jgi:hypothetical protein
VKIRTLNTSLFLVTTSTPPHSLWVVGVTCGGNFTAKFPGWKWLSTYFLCLPLVFGNMVDIEIALILLKTRRGHGKAP